MLRSPVHREHRRRPRWIRIASVTLVGFIALAAVAIVVLSKHPKDVAPVVACTAAVLGLATALVPKIWALRADRSLPVDATQELTAAASILAKRVQEQWDGEAARRGVTVPATVMVSWKRHAPYPANPSRAIQAPRGVRPRDIPIEPPATPRQMDAGVVTDLHALYADKKTNKILITGQPGAGKSGALILLLLEALDQRDSVPSDQQYAVPVPVLLTLGDWDPVHETLTNWASKVLERDYGAVFTSGGDTVYELLLADGRISLFLDGFEEMPEGFWSAARRRIQEAARVRVVLTSRPAVCKPRTARLRHTCAT